MIFCLSAMVFLDMLGYCAEEIKTNFHNSALALVHSADRERIAAQLARESHFTEPFTLEYRVVTKAGKTLWLLDKVCLIHDESGAPVLYSMRIDNTAKKEAEMQLHVRSEWFRIAMEHSKSHIFEYNVVTHSFDSVISPPDSMQPLLPKHIESMPGKPDRFRFCRPRNGRRLAFRLSCHRRRRSLRRLFAKSKRRCHGRIQPLAEPCAYDRF